MQKRSKARELALQILYQCDFDTFDVQSIDYVFAEFQIKETEIFEFTKEIIAGVIEYIKPLDTLIETTLINWKLSRISLIDKTLLRMGVFEIIKMESIEKKITISEIIKLAKNYSDSDAYKFINGILDRFEKCGSFDMESAIRK
ncbi:MAG TPA: transcription antitermination factor NusB [bacterium]|nr:transcription antitermination factor NusB [bacterium]